MILSETNFKRALWLSLSFYVAFSFASISLTQVVAGAGLAVLLLFHFSYGKKTRLSFPLLLPFSAYIGVGLLAIVFGVSPETSASYLKKFLEPLLFFWILNALIVLNRPSATPEGSAPGPSALVMGNWRLNLPPKNPVSFLSHGIITVGVLASLIGLLEVFQGDNLPRPSGTLDNPITFGVFIMITFALTLSRLGFGGNNGVRFYLIVPAAIIQLACLFATQTREAWVGAFVIFIIFFGKKIRWWFYLTATLVMLYLAAPNALQSKLQGLATLNDSSAQLRFMLWKVGRNIILDNPVLGCGYKCSRIVWDKYSNGVEVPFLLRDQHNMYLQIAVDTGLLGLGVWSWIWISYFMILRRKWNQLGSDHPDRWILYGSVGSLAGFFTAGIFECHFYDQEIIMLLYLIMAIPLAMNPNEKQEKIQTPP